MLQPVVKRQHVQADVGPYNFNAGLSEEGCRGAQEFDLEGRGGREGGREGQGQVWGVQRGENGKCPSI